MCIAICPPLASQFRLLPIRIIKLRLRLWVAVLNLDRPRLTVGVHPAFRIPELSQTRVLDLYGVGSRQTFTTPNLVKELNLKVGNPSTGDSLGMTPVDEAAIIVNDATVKDMEVVCQKLCS